MATRSARRAQVTPAPSLAGGRAPVAATPQRAGRSTLSLEGILPFRRRVELDLHNQGLVLIRGRNMVSSAADSNGVGKTSIAHGLSFAWFGEDLSGRRADAIACRFTEDQGTAHWETVDAIGPWSITRTTRPSSLVTTGIAGVLENEDMRVLQQKIEQRLGFGVRTFKNAVVFGQGTFERFAHADQAEAMRMLDEIQGLDFRGALERTKAWRDLLTSRKLDADEKTRVADSRLDGLAQTIADLERARDSYEESRKTRLDEARAARTAVAVRGRVVREEAEHARAAAAELKILTGLKAAADAGIEAVTKASDAEYRSADSIRALDNRTVEMQRELDALIESGECPTCLLPLKSKADRNAAEKRRAPSLKKLIDEARAAHAAHEATVRAVDAATDAANESSEVLADALPEGKTAVAHIAELSVICSPRAAALRDRARADVARDEQLVDQSIAAIERERWSGAGTLASRKLEVGAHRATREREAERLVKLGDALNLAAYWLEGFGDRGVRSLLVDGAAAFVNERVAAHLEQLAGGEASLVMSAQTALKKGGARERLSFTPEWSWGGSGAGTGSGGQDRRVDLALFAGVQDLSESRSARPFPLKIWDEPGDALDARGQELFCQWVCAQARARGTGLLITHAQGIAEGVEPDRVWTVVMERDGARVEVS